MDRDTDFRISARTAIEGTGSVLFELTGFVFGPPNERLSFFLRDNDEVDQIIRLSANGVYTLSADAFPSTPALERNGTSIATWSFSLTAVPEPGVGMLVGMGLAGLSRVGRKKR